MVLGTYLLFGSLGPCSDTELIALHRVHCILQASAMGPSLAVCVLWASY